MHRFGFLSLLLLWNFGERIKASPARLEKYDGGKIVGGYEVVPNSIPYQVSLQMSYGFHFCGGVIITNDAVLTAGHCCISMSPTDDLIIAGEHDLKKESGIEVTKQISQIIVHEEFGLINVENDICLIKLRDSFEFNDKVGPAKLPKQDQEFDGNSTVSGWGTISSSGPTSDVLLAVEVDIVPLEECKESYVGTYLDESMICAAAEGKDACQGDSGGPLTCGNDHTLCGLVSWGEGCAEPEFPGVYTRVSKFVTWINQHLSNSE